MQRASADFTNTFRSLARQRLLEGTNASSELEAWHHRLVARRLRQRQSAADVEGLMRRHNPAVIPRNQNVRRRSKLRRERKDYSVMERLLEVLATPYDHSRSVPMFSA
jgi:serine/tyrosine/threonine adenylyltransferase